MNLQPSTFGYHVHEADYNKTKTEIQDKKPFLGKRIEMRYLPHHQASHDEGVEDSEETINRCRVKTGK